MGGMGMTQDARQTQRPGRRVSGGSGGRKLMKPEETSGKNSGFFYTLFGIKSATKIMKNLDLV